MRSSDSISSVGLLNFIFQRREMFGGTAAFTTAEAFKAGTGHMLEEFILENAVGCVIHLLAFFVEDGVTILVHGLFGLPFL